MDIPEIESKIQNLKSKLIESNKLLSEASASASGSGSPSKSDLEENLQLKRSIEELDSEDKQFSSLLELKNPTAKDVFQHAADGDLFAQEIVEFTAKTLGESLADFACFSSPKSYILFGGIAQSGHQFARRVKIHMEQQLLPIYQGKIEVRISALHDTNAAVLGAASLVPHIE